MLNLSEREACGSTGTFNTAPPGEPHVSGVMLRVLADVLSRGGPATQPLVDELAMRLAAREAVHLRVPLSRFRTLLQRALDATGDPALGLQCGLYASESAYDMLTPLLSYVPSLRDAVREGSRFRALVLDDAGIELREGAGIAELRVYFPRAHDRTDACLSDFLNAGLVRLLRAFGAHRDDLLTVHVEHAGPRHRAAYQRAFGEAVQFGAAYTGVTFDATLLDRPNLHHNPALHRAMRAQAEHRLRQLSRPLRADQRVVAYLRGQVDCARPDMTVVARALGMSERSLRRRLAEVGTSYRELVQDVQQQRACSLLRDHELSLQTVADAVGYRDMAAFHRAFKRWTGQTTSAYRATH